ncbi:ABC transporter permease [Candidatus Saccharibacteria bacterium]|jgi:ABC-2 type transport system permease protein|nr:ABC transporter permease [Candidatus Saccharibacteria bacterium]HOR23496.1 ABC transporter permease [Candidatus Saccharibacteria bacterium]
MKKSLYTVLTFVKINTKRFFRDRLAMFFTIVFPLVFLVIFGGLFKSENINFRVAIINHSNSAYSKQFIEQSKTNKTIKVNSKVTDLEQAKEKMKKSELDAVIVLPHDFGEVKNSKYPSGQAMVYYSQNNQQAGQTFTSVVQEQFSKINSKLVAQETPFSVVAKSTNQNSTTSFDYIFAGMLGFSVIGLGLLGPVNVFPELKKQGVLRRLHTTTLKTWQYFMSNVISQGIIGLGAIAVLFTFSILVFNLKMIGSYFDFVVFIILSIIAIYGLGLAIGGWAKNERQAAPLANLITFPMIFLSGTFFPRFLMPEWLQMVSSYLPLTPINDGVRLIVTEGKHLSDLLPQIGLISVWAVVIYIVAFRIFRWE